MLPIIIDLMKNGASIVEVCVELGISRETFYDWKNPNSERFNQNFSDTVTRGMELAEAWFEKQGRLNLSNREFNARLFQFISGNRFGWSEKKAIDHTSNGQSYLDVLKAISESNNSNKLSAGDNE